jgi:hypothetical protein
LAGQLAPRHVRDYRLDFTYSVPTDTLPEQQHVLDK